jgi:hypothetical protein
MGRGSVPARPPKALRVTIPFGLVPRPRRGRGTNDAQTGSGDPFSAYEAFTDLSHFPNICFS